MFFNGLNGKKGYLGQIFHFSKCHCTAITIWVLFLKFFVIKNVRQKTTSTAAALLYLRIVFLNSCNRLLYPAPVPRDLQSLIQPRVVQSFLSLCIQSSAERFPWYAEFNYSWRINRKTKNLIQNYIGSLLHHTPRTVFFFVKKSRYSVLLDVCA